jgi:hypothetical protein
MKNIFTYSTALLLGLGLLATPEADAQQFSKRKQYNSVGFSLNAMNYFGDVTPSTSFTSFRFLSTRPNVAVSFTRRFYPRVSGRVSLSYGRITGDDSKAANQNDQDARYRFNRNMNFRNDILEASGVVIVDLIENRNNYLKRPDFVPYVFAGVAGFYHNPKGQYKDGEYVELQPLGTEGQRANGGTGYSLTQFSIPFGGGVRYRINRNFDASLEIGWRKTFTDYLDDVSGVYAPAEAFPAGQEVASYFAGVGGVYPSSLTLSNTGAFNGFNVPGEKRGTGDKTDWYIVTGVSLNYILTPRIKNPKFR